MPKKIRNETCRTYYYLLLDIYVLFFFLYSYLKNIVGEKFALYGACENSASDRR